MQPWPTSAAGDVCASCRDIAGFVTRCKALRLSAAQEILADERVQGAIKAGRGSRVRDAEETAGATSVTGLDDGREQAAAGNGATPSSQNGASADAKPQGSAPAGEATAREWIENWRERQNVTAGSK